MSFKEYSAYDAVGLAELVRSKQVSPGELLDEAVARTDRIDPAINAVVVRHDDYARRQIESGLPDGPFTGVPFLLKDLDTIAGTRTTYGSTAYKDFIADRTSTIAARYLAAGLTIYGKSSSPEFGAMITTETRLHGPTRNPWNLDHSSGGSSGGAAAAVAARILPVAHATDGGGSIRVPSSICGVFGLKPTRARTPLGPDRAEGWGGFSCGHVVSVSVRDSAAMLDVAHGPEPTSQYHAPKPDRAFLEEVEREPGRLRIFFTDRAPNGDAIDPEIAAALRDVARMLEGLGHHVEERAPLLGADPSQVAVPIIPANIGAMVQTAAKLLGCPINRDHFETMTLAYAEIGRSATAIDYVQALQNAFVIKRGLTEFFDGCDVFLSPTLCLPPVRIGEIDTMSEDLGAIRARLRRYVPGTSMFNMSGQPSMSVPLAWNAAGLPLGMMFTGQFGDEATLLRLASQLEQEKPWKDRLPPTCA